MAELWERQTDPETGRDEPDQAFQAFTLYRDMSPRARSLPAVHAALKALSANTKVSGARAGGTEVAGPEKRIRSSRVGEWSGRWNWVLRARAWDNERDRVKRQAQLEEEVAVGKRHAQTCDAYLRAMQQPMVAFLQRLQMDPAMLAKMDPIALMKLMAVFARATPRMMQAERIARGMPTVIDPKAKAFENAGGGEESLPVDGFVFGWEDIACAVCGHPHAKHDQMHEDPAIVPCTVDGCKCQKFKKE